MKNGSICHIEITNANQMPRVWRAAESAHSAGYDVTIIGFGESFEKNGVHFIGFPETNNRFERMFCVSRKMVRQAVKTEAEIIQLHSPEQLLSVHYLLRKKRKIVFDSHEFYGMQIELKEYIPLFLRKPIAMTYRFFERFVCKKIDGVLYPCTIGGKNYFEGIARRSCKIENYSAPVHTPVRINPPERMIIYAGSLTYERGITSLVDAINMVENCKLVLCGSFDTEEYKRKILSMSDRIEYYGIINREDLFSLYSCCAVGMALLLPIGQYLMVDNMSTKVYEYMQCGVPVVCSNLPFSVRQNNKYHFGICVDPEKPDEIADAIQILLDNPEEAKRLGENGRRAIAKEYNWKNEEKKLLDFYDAILHE